ncbi:hypothetical protein VTO42DRAFT_3865 [Malbranchea cinnamomea]
MQPRTRKAPRLADRRRQAAGDASASHGGEKEDIFHFVNVNPTSETQKSENRSVIRSHASKYIWRQHRAVRTDGTAAGSSSSMSGGLRSASGRRKSPDNRNQVPIRAEASIAPYPPPSSHREPAWTVPVPVIKTEPLTAPVPASETPAMPTTRVDGANSHMSEDSFEEEKEDVNGPVNNPPYVSPANLTVESKQNMLSGPFNHLMAWMEDPVFPSSMLDESAVSKLLRYAAFDLWPGLVLGADEEAWDRGAAAKHWLPRAMSNKALYTAFLYGAAGHMQTRKRLECSRVAPQTRQEKMEQIICESLTIKQLNALMKDPSQSTSDEIILAVLCMAFNRIDYSGWNTTDPTPKAPLRNLQWLDVYGGLSLNDQHIKGLLALIESKGGIHKMELPGLAVTLSAANIMLSTKYLAKPRLPFVPIFKNTAEGKTPGWPSLEPADGLNLFGGDGVDPISKAALPKDLTQILQNMRDYNAVINLYTQGLLPGLGLANIADRRNYIQYSLASLSSVYEFPELFLQANRTYEPCRLAAMSYSMHVIYPLPAANRPFKRLSSLLKVALLDSEIESGSWGHAMEMLLWVLVLGGMTSRNMPERPWFVSTLYDAINIAGISTWAQLKDIMISIMWMDSVCDVGGQALWEEVVRLRQTSL